jgi:dienelactone hydrolase
MRGLMAIIVIVLVVIVAEVVGGGKSTPKPKLTVATAVHYGVGITNCTFVDTTRMTPDYTDNTSKPDRVLVTEIRYPTLTTKRGVGEISGAKPARTHGPFPLVVFGHGYDLTPNTYAKLLDRWVEAGYVVAAPLFPDTNAEAVATQSAADTFLPEADDINQPGDMAFVTKELIHATKTSVSACHVAQGLIKTSEVALAGQSDGATTAVALAFDPKYEVAGVHYKAVIDLSGELFGQGTVSPDKLSVNASSPALFVSQSATDTCNPPQYSTAIYNGVATSKKWFLKIVDAYHLPPYIGTDVRAFNIVATTTTQFLADEFANKSPGSALLKLGNVHRAVASLSTGAKAPAIASLTQSSSDCYEGLPVIK